MNIKLAFIAFFAAIAVVFTAFAKGATFSKVKILAKAEKKAREVEHRAVSAMVDGLNREAKGRPIDLKGRSDLE